MIRHLGMAGLALFCCAGPAMAEPTTVTVTATDGVSLRATYDSPGRPGPGVILLHQCDMNRASWLPLTAALSARGVHSITLDYRGYGENRSLPAEYPKLQGDIDAALAALHRQPGVDTKHIGVVGASCGVDHAVQLARRSGQISAIVLLSGGTSDAGLTYLEQSNLPVFFAFSTDEGGPLPAVKGAVGRSKNRQSLVREFGRAGHGVRMFSAEPSLLPSMVEWLAQALR